MAIFLRYGWTLEPKSSSLMPSAWAVSLLWEVTMPMTITATGMMVFDRTMDENQSYLSSIFINNYIE